MPKVGRDSGRAPESVATGGLPLGDIYFKIAIICISSDEEFIEESLGSVSSSSPKTISVS